MNIVKMKKLLPYFLTAFLFISILAGCGGLPSDLKKACKKIPQRIETGEKLIDKNHAAYKDFIKKDELKKIKPAFTKEILTGVFKEAHEDLGRVEAIYTTNLKPLLDANKEELAVKVLAELKKINTAILDAENKSKYPLKRVKHLNNVLLQIDSVHKESLPKSDNIDRTVKELETDLLIRAKENFPEKADKIDTKFTPLVLMARQSKNAQKALDSEYINHKNNNKTDYSIIADSAALLDNNYRQVQILKKEFSNNIDSLSKSYTKILKDMKPIHSVVVKRESWNNSQDFYNPKIAIFAREISPEVFEFIETNTIETIVELYPSWNNLKMKNHIGNIWKKLEINPVDNWPRQQRHDSASFWFDNWSTKYFHQYTIVEDGEKHDTDWEVVSEGIYENNFEYLGMAILTKPFGMFEDEADTNAAPPGMAFVGNPEYGKWEKNSSGGSFWSWYGKYALFSNLLFYSTMGPVRYSNWNGYNRNYRGRQPYFGKTAQGSAKYGTSGAYTKNSSAFRSSSFARMGGSKRPAPSVRGAASSVRGGGPKAKGK
ncbi:MAG: hypothetical protein K8R67_00885 [Desulfobacteraceae bacterium]|nr:hypothetical protein [Desulfobacteraceae bacterium]